METFNYGALLLFAQKVADEIKANAAPPAPNASINAADILTELNAVIPTWQAAWAAHRGLATGVADILARLADNGVPYAAMIRNALLATPGALIEAEKWLPTIEWALSSFTPAPNPPGGMEPDRDLHGRG